MSYLENAIGRLHQAETAAGVADDRGDWSHADEARRLMAEAIVYAILAVAVEIGGS